MWGACAVGLCLCVPACVVCLSPRKQPPSHRVSRCFPRPSPISPPPQGHDAAWNGQGPEVLLVHVMLEVAEALAGEDLGAMLDTVGAFRGLGFGVQVSGFRV
jgi:hypothetical protein